MKKILVSLVSVVLCSLPAYAFDVSSITFGQASSAKTSTPNLRIGEFRGQLARDGNVAIQAMPIPRPVNYYLTKSQTYTFTAGITAIQIQVDQATKMYVGDDLTNYLLLPASSDYTYIIR